MSYFCKQIRLIVGVILCATLFQVHAQEMKSNLLVFDNKTGNQEIVDFPSIYTNSSQTFFVSDIVTSSTDSNTIYIGGSFTTSGTIRLDLIKVLKSGSSSPTYSIYYNFVNWSFGPVTSIAQDASYLYVTGHDSSGTTHYLKKVTYK